MITPDWPAPPQVIARVTQRAGGVSHPPYDSLNLAMHVGDDPVAVLENRRRLSDVLGLPMGQFCWLQQVHGTRTVEALPTTLEPPPEADAVWTACPDLACVVLTADCLPVLLCAADGSRVAAAHAGWRGLLNGVIESAVHPLGPAADVLAWLGPAIGPESFEVGAEVRDAFAAEDRATLPLFRAHPSNPDKWLGDLYALARRRLHRLGVARVFGGGYCTFRDPQFFSYRRESLTGRMASLIYLKSR